MRALLTTIGSRGDVQPLAALAVQLRALDQEVRVCAPPDFRDQIEGLGIPFTPVGPELISTGRTGPSPVPLTLEERRRLVEASVAAQFDAVTAAARGCDVIVEGGYLVLAARTVAERLGIPYVMAGYCPIFFPSPHHAPPVYPMLGEKPADGTDDNRALWARDAQRWNGTWGAILNSHRQSAGLAPVTDVRDYLITDKPWLAADPILGPWPGAPDLEVTQTGAWILPDRRPLSPELEEFLEAGEPPIYFGFGSIRAPEDLGKTMIETARALGCRAIVQRGWADLSLLDDGLDCLAIGEVNQQALFRRVAAVSTTAARGPRPRPRAPDRPRSSFPSMSTNPTGRGESRISGSEPHTRPAHRQWNY